MKLIYADKTNVFMRKGRRGFRFWYYFRSGYGTYFAFILAATNTLTVTYYLAIEKFPSLQEIFPSFGQYILVMACVGIPLLIVIGYIHYKRTAAYSSEMDVQIEANPYVYKLPKNGWWQQALFPLFLLQSQLISKMSRNEKVTDADLKNLEEIQKKLDLMIKGGSFEESSVL